MTKNTKNRLIVLMLTVGVLSSCTPISRVIGEHYPIETNYEIGVPLIVNVGSYMLDIVKMYKYQINASRNSSLGPVWESREGWRFRATLTYTGRSESTIKVTYREFYGGLAREAFDLNVETETV